MLLGVFAAKGVLPIEFKPAYSVGDLLTQHLDDMEEEVNNQGGVMQTLADHFAKVYEAVQGDRAYTTRRLSPMTPGFCRSSRLASAAAAHKPAPTWAARTGARATPRERRGALRWDQAAAEAETGARPVRSPADPGHAAAGAVSTSARPAAAPSSPCGDSGDSGDSGDRMEGSTGARCAPRAGAGQARVIIPRSITGSRGHGSGNRSGVSA
jgi:hypothetical protein